jgi:tagatose-1,6-bisphosphate aldolase non-catalytic subunit AgaZ/GatZ
MTRAERPTPDLPSTWAINASVYIVEKQVAGKNRKIHAGLARGCRGVEQVIDLDTTRDRARELVATAKKHGADPKVIGERIEVT